MVRKYKTMSFFCLFCMKYELDNNGYLIFYSAVVFFSTKTSVRINQTPANMHLYSQQINKISFEVYFNSNMLITDVQEL